MVGLLGLTLQGSGSSRGRYDEQWTGCPSSERRIAKNSVKMTGSTGISTA
jgi:hypothetical protein